MNRVYNMKTWLIIAVIYAHNLSSCEIKVWKYSGLEPESRSGLNFFQAWFHNCLSCVHNCDDQSCLHIFLRGSKYIDLSYIHLQGL